MAWNVQWTNKDKLVHNFVLCFFLYLSFRRSTFRFLKCFDWIVEWIIKPENSVCKLGFEFCLKRLLPSMKFGRNRIVEKSTLSAKLPKAVSFWNGFILKQSNLTDAIASCSAVGLLKGFQKLTMALIDHFEFRAIWHRTWFNSWCAVFFISIEKWLSKVSAWHVGNMSSVKPFKWIYLDDFTYFFTQINWSLVRSSDPCFHKNGAKNYEWHLFLNDDKIDKLSLITWWFIILKYVPQ